MHVPTLQILVHMRSSIVMKVVKCVSNIMSNMNPLHPTQRHGILILLVNTVKPIFKRIILRQLVHKIGVTFVDTKTRQPYTVEVVNPLEKVNLTRHATFENFNRSIITLERSPINRTLDLVLFTEERRCLLQLLKLEHTQRLNRVTNPFRRNRPRMRRRNSHLRGGRTRESLWRRRRRRRVFHPPQLIETEKKQSST
uniref:Uncharacterized protein n=1 Tax=Glycine max TaxID=3847 RepID=A0A0R0GI57_SOYBN